jgi:rod shape-determining protein MreC
VTRFAGRPRAGWLFTVVALAHVILISAQVNTRRGVPVLETVVLGAVAEIQRASAMAIGAVRQGWDGYFALQDVRRENERLRGELARLQIELQQERAWARQTRTLETLLDLRAQTTLATAAARVIAGSGSHGFRTLTIDKGTLDGIAADMPVIAPAGVVGRVILPSARASKVQLLVDSNAAAGALVERSRAQGIVVGTGTDRLRMEYVPGTANIQIGDRVVTSGIEGIYRAAADENGYPKGFVIGQIESIQRGPGSVRIVVKPAVDFSALEAVLVVVEPGAPAPVAPPAEAVAAVSGNEAK